MTDQQVKDMKEKREVNLTFEQSLAILGAYGGFYGLVILTAYVTLELVIKWVTGL